MVLEGRQCKAVFDFSMTTKKKTFELLFEKEGNLQLIWQFSDLNFSDQDIIDTQIKIQATRRRPQ